MPAQPEFQQRLESIEELLGKIEAAADPSLRTTVQELVQLVMDLHGAGLERMLELIRARRRAEAADRFKSWARRTRGEPAGPVRASSAGPRSARHAGAGKGTRCDYGRMTARWSCSSIQDGAVRLRLQANGQDVARPRRL